MRQIGVHHITEEDHKPYQIAYMLASQNQSDICLWVYCIIAFFYLERYRCLLLIGCIFVLCRRDRFPSAWVLGQSNKNAA